MNTTKRTTANLREDLLQEATEITGLGITETLHLGLEMIKRSAAFAKAQKLKGKLDLTLDIDKSRERTYR